MGKQHQRQKELINIVRTRGLLPIKTLASMLNVSEMTIRRDFRLLETSQDTSSISDTQNSSYNLLQAAQFSNAQKEAIGAFAASLIQPNDAIIIDTGSTTARILPHIQDDLDLTVLCYNANVLMELRHKPNMQLFFSGGIYHRNTEMFESAEGIQFIKRIRCDKVFLSAAGIHKELGITCVNSYEVPTKQAIIESSLEKILVADSSKFERFYPSFFASLDKIDVIVTDTGLTREWQSFICEQGITLHIVQVQL
jgi:DeoR family deoxyribose operon repressor